MRHCPVQDGLEVGFEDEHHWVDQHGFRQCRPFSEDKRMRIVRKIIKIYSSDASGKTKQEGGRSQAGSVASDYSVSIC